MNSKYRSVFFAVLLFAFSPLVIISFQNCAPAVFTGFKGNDITPGDSSGGGGSSGGDIGGSSGGNPGEFALQDQSIQTGFNQPVTWLASYLGQRDQHILSLGATAIQNESVIANVGRVVMSDPNEWRLRFEPNFGFRGEVSFWLFAHRAGQVVSQAQVRVSVGSSVNILKPALAVRAGGCVMCHAEVHANIVTDFGFGNAFYFGQNVGSSFAWNDGSPYGDHEALFTYGNGYQGVGAWARLKFFNGTGANHSGKVIVPNVAIPNGPKNATGQTTLKGYLQHRLQDSEYASTRSAQVETRNRVFIGAPSATRLQEAFQWNNADQNRGFKFFAQSNSSWPLSGLNTNASSAPSNGLFFNTSIIVCEGDVLLKGSLHLNRARIRTRSGCRLHVTEDVVISGPIEFVTDAGSDYSKRNIQIVASRSILMGLGNIWSNGLHCEQNQSDSGYWSYYHNRDKWTQGMTAAQRQQFDENIADSAKYRLRYFWGIPNFFLRGVNNPLSHSQTIYSSVTSKVALIMDAACEPEQRNVRYERILLNAPLIHNRYAGGIKGSVISEFALMPLGLAQNQSRFRFEFDPVFSQVDILPMLKDQDFLKVD